MKKLLEMCCAAKADLLLLLFGCSPEALFGFAHAFAQNRCRQPLCMYMLSSLDTRVEMQLKPSLDFLTCDDVRRDSPIQFS